MKKLNIIYEDKELLVINKPAKLLTVGTKDEKEHTLYHEVREYIRKKNQKVFIVHRLDKDTSGIVVFAKNENLKNLLQNNWYKAKREYIAIVQGKMPKTSDTIKSYLKENAMFQVYVTNSRDGHQAITSYKVLATNKSMSLLSIDIKTGRKNQIRCQLASVGNPIAGDKKYESTINPLGRLALHSTKVSFMHPTRNKLLEFNCPAPKTFYLSFPDYLDNEKK